MERNTWNQALEVSRRKNFYHYDRETNISGASKGAMNVSLTHSFSVCFPVYDFSWTSVIMNPNQGSFDGQEKAIYEKATFFLLLLFVFGNSCLLHLTLTVILS